MCVLQSILLTSLLHYSVSVADIRYWMITNKLKTNDHEIELLLLISTFAKPTRHIQISIGKYQMQSSPSCKGLLTLTAVAQLMHSLATLRFAYCNVQLHSDSMQKKSLCRGRRTLLQGLFQCVPDAMTLVLYSTNWIGCQLKNAFFFKCCF